MKSYFFKIKKNFLNKYVIIKCKGKKYEDKSFKRYKKNV